jgi:NTP pyrophosphatase (non-canonical NTP hydrolase)
VAPRATRRRDLRIRELAHWAEAQLGWLARKSRADKGSDLFLYIQAAKLVEEVGELHSELLSRGKRQRQGKSVDPAGVEGELADVVICVTIIAQTLGVDLARALVDKMQVVDDRVAQAAKPAG